MSRMNHNGGGESPCGSGARHGTPDVKSTRPADYTPSPHLLDHGYGATPINQVMSIPAQAPPVKRKLNMESHHFMVPIKEEFKAPSQPPKQRQQRRQTPIKKNTRYDTSLSLLTVKFSDLLERSPDGVVDLNKASAQLNVQKRRIYDITNVLEGIGILEKKSKNKIQWKGAKGNSHHYQTLKRKMRRLEDHENNLDKMISSAENELIKLNNDRFGYVTYHDLRSIERFRDSTVMAIRAPPNTQLSIPNTRTDEHSIQMKSECGEIEVFLCPEEVVPPPPPPPPPSDLLLRDEKLSPTGLFDMTTPPVPQLDSPAIPPTTTRNLPISSQICRSLFFTKEEDAQRSATTTSPSYPSTSAYTSAPHRPGASCIGDDLFNLSPIDMDSKAEGSMPMMHVDGTNPGPMVGRFNFSSSDGGGQQTDTGGNLGVVDPLFSNELVTLEPLTHPEYNLNLDAGEGLSNLFFDYDLLFC